eukprot:m.47824 g.47824  ORF g.47824 m.47824 type:complete len:168 (+) comp6384_c0_seq1:2775-3278(+)
MAAMGTRLVVGLSLGAARVAGQKVLCLFGRTGVGKSTFTHCAAGSEFKLENGVYKGDSSAVAVYSTGLRQHWVGLRLSLDVNNRRHVKLLNSGSYVSRRKLRDCVWTCTCPYDVTAENSMDAAHTNGTSTHGTSNGYTVKCCTVLLSGSLPISLCVAKLGSHSLKWL